MRSHLLLYLFFCLLAVQKPIAQTSIGGVINRYFKVTAFTPATGSCSAPATPASMTIGAAYGNPSPATLAVGMEVLIMQMKAGTTGSMNRTTGSAVYGDVNNAGGAGNYEFATIATVVGSTITFTTRLVNTYDPSGQVQLIPTWLGNTSATAYTSNATIIPLTYNETLGVGGVVTISTTNTITLNHDIDASAMGYYGGDTIGDAYKTTWPPNHIQYACCGSLVLSGGNAADFTMDATNAGIFALPLILTEDRTFNNTSCPNAGVRIIKGSRKGRGIFGIFTSEETSKGKAGNGGGGGHGFNTGGGGGGGYNGGGNGGYELAWACNNGATQPAGMDHGGRGGLGMQGGTTAIFMGGGGGAGQGDGNTQTLATQNTGGYPAGDYRGPTSGGDGGGIVILKSSQIISSGARTINVKGGNGGFSSQDGAGGGGGGGSIVLQVSTYSGTLTLDASGGNGGNAINPNSGDCHGPGGGGGAGRVVLSTAGTPAGVTINNVAGIAGRLLQQLNSGAGLYVGDKTANFCGANINWGANAGTDAATLNNTNINTQVCTTPLTTILSVEAKFLSNNSINVLWSTSSLDRVSHFVIERSVDAVHFEEIGKQNTTNKANQLQYYAFVDEKAPMSHGTIYYHIKTVGVTGSEEYSGITGVVVKGKFISLYPNPAKEFEELAIKYFSYRESEEIDIKIYDMLGKEVFKERANAYKESNELILKNCKLGKGVFILEISDEFGTNTEKITVQ